MEKFRLLWRNSPQAQMTVLDKQLETLLAISASLSAINEKVGVLPDIKSAIDKHSLKLQEISDNTSCACNALENAVQHQIAQNDRLDVIIDLLRGVSPPEPVPVYQFLANLESYTITDADIQNGYFVVDGYSLKDNVQFDSVTVDVCPAWLNPVVDASVGGQFRFSLTGVTFDPGLYWFQLRQLESNLFLKISFERPAPVVDYVRFLSGAVVPLTTQADVNSLSGLSSSVTLGGVVYPRSTVVAVHIASISYFAYGIPNYFLCDCTNLVELSLPDSIQRIGSNFLRFCSSFNAPLSFPDVISIESGFLYSCSSFNSEVSFSEKLGSISHSFMINCHAYDRPLSLPQSLYEVGYCFMYGCRAFVGPLDLGSLPADIFVVSSDDTFVVPDSSYPAYVKGVQVVGDNAAAFASRFPNLSSGTRWRKLLAPVPVPVYISKNVRCSLSIHSDSSSNEVILNPTLSVCLILLENGIEVYHYLVAATFPHISPGESPNHTVVDYVNIPSVDTKIVGFKYSVTSGGVFIKGGTVQLSVSGDGSTPSFVFGGSLVADQNQYLAAPVSVSSGGSEIIVDMQLDVVAKI